MKFRDGPAAVIPPFFYKRGTFLTMRATVQNSDGKAVKKEGKSEDLPQDCEFRASVEQGLWFDPLDKKGHPGSILSVRDFFLPRTKGN